MARIVEPCTNLITDWDVIEGRIVAGDDEFKLLDNNLVIQVVSLKLESGVCTFPYFLGWWDPVKRTMDWDLDINDIKHEFPSARVLEKRYRQLNNEHHLNNIFPIPEAEEE